MTLTRIKSWLKMNVLVILVLHVGMAKWLTGRWKHEQPESCLVSLRLWCFWLDPPQISLTASCCLEQNLHSPLTPPQTCSTQWISEALCIVFMSPCQNNFIYAMLTRYIMRLNLAIWLNSQCITLSMGQIIHQHIQTLILFIQELLSPSNKKNAREGKVITMSPFFKHHVLVPGCGQWRNSPNVIGPQGDLQLSQDLGGFLNAPLKLWSRN